jgi:hypothetical protein
MMSVIWEQRVLNCERGARRLDRASPNFMLLATNRHADEWRMVFAMLVQVMVLGPHGVQRIGPCQLGFRYHRRHLACAPEPTELVTVLSPHNIFHPNIASSGTMCLGHTRPGFSLEAIAHQVWGGLNMNGAFVNTAHGQVLNWQAAEYVRQNLHLFPISRRGLYEGD